VEVVLVVIMGLETSRLEPRCCHPKAAVVVVMVVVDEERINNCVKINKVTCQTLSDFKRTCVKKITAHQTHNTTPRLSPCQQMKQARHVVHEMAQATFGLQVYFSIFI
jgi:hypothetical protein